MTSKASFAVDRVKKMKNESQDSMELLRFDIQVAAGDWCTFHFAVTLSRLSSWYIHLNDTGTLFNETVD